MGFLRVIDPGLLSTVQDLGRPGFAHLGIPIGGAADPLALRAANLLVGNSENTAAIEITLTGASFDFENEATIAIAGAPLACELRSATGDRRDISRAWLFHVEQGDRLVIRSLVEDARAYLCIAGGLRVPLVLGSASTNIGAGFGGVEGRPLRRGDRLEYGTPSLPPIHNRMEMLSAWSSAVESPKLRIQASIGPHSASIDPGSLASFWTSPFRVSSKSDRVGIRLEGGPPLRAGCSDGRMTTEGMTWGAVQLPPDGNPIILMCDHPTTGGYPVIACVAAMYLPVLGQLRPGDAVRFTPAHPAATLQDYQEQQRHFARAAGL